MKKALYFFSSLLLASVLLYSLGSSSELTATIETSSTSRLPKKIEALSWDPRIFIVRNFLSDGECNYIINKAMPNLALSKVVDANSNQGVSDASRSSQSTYFAAGHDDAIIKDIEERISFITMIPQENGEPLQVHRYQIDGEYKPHYDYFDSANSGGKAHLQRGGQRLATVIMYLNTPEKGGETIFPKLNITVPPKKGDALVFFNCCLNGVADPQTLHGGAPVLKGEKWIATRWLRQNAFK